MIEIELPNDITKVESKIMGMVTPRQLGCLSVAVLFTVIMRVSVKGTAFESMKDVLTMITAGIPLCFVLKVQGMYFEKFLHRFLFSNILSPTKRKYKTANSYEKIYKKEMKDENYYMYLYYKNHKNEYKVVKNDIKEDPRPKKNKKKPELTGYV